MRISFFLFALGLALLAPACGKRPSHSAESSSQPPAPSTNTQVFDVKGTVVELKLAEKTVRIKHEEIPGYMPAMTMPFEVKDVSELDRLEAGDPVSFRMIVTGDDAWIDQVRKLNAPVNTTVFPANGPGLSAAVAAGNSFSGWMPNSRMRANTFFPAAEAK